LQVVPPLIADSAPLGPRLIGYHEEIIALRRIEAHDYLQGLAEGMEQEGVHAAAAAVLGPGVAETILNVARGDRIDLLAVATRGQGGIRRLTLGSVADKLVRAAEVPVLVIRPTKVS
jgi:nucleotide-binding universal stress UspA family protein